MPGMSAADRYLLEQVSHGDESAWTQLVTRFQGRLLSFAAQQLSESSDAEDAVQETFLSFIRSLSTFRGEASLETWLFGILRRRIVDIHRARGRNSVVLLCSLQTDDDQPATEFPGGDMSASWYARRDEARDSDRAALSAALLELLGRFQEEQNFRDIIVAELLFYAQQRNQHIATLTGATEQQIALLKHRFLKRLAAGIAERSAHSPATDDSDPGVSTSLLTELWEQHRPRCPKRSTLGKFLLGSLDDEWTRYVAFHTDELGCRFCLANLHDLEESADRSDGRTRLSSRIMNSTIGFLSDH